MTATRPTFGRLAWIAPSLKADLAAWQENMTLPAWTTNDRARQAVMLPMKDGHNRRDPVPYAPSDCPQPHTALRCNAPAYHVGTIPYHADGEGKAITMEQSGYR